MIYNSNQLKSSCRVITKKYFVLKLIAGAGNGHSGQSIALAVANPSKKDTENAQDLNMAERDALKRMAIRNSITIQNLAESTGV